MAADRLLILSKLDRLDRSERAVMELALFEQFPDEGHEPEVLHRIGPF